ncbi:MAG: prolyl oligopeptidase family serine peptidase [Clostridia bacterium]|nr:prolyl oligopeptidase family serine peptidase [Clostridia bacterium]
MLNDRITPENITLFAYTNGDNLKGEPREIVVDFHGLNYTSIIKKDDDYISYYTDRDIIYIFPYYGPWSWMNEASVAMVDDIITAVADKYKAYDVPVVITGGSMGGLSALVYTVYASVTPAACAANCPVCDLVEHYNERNDLPRTLIAAYGYRDGDLSEKLKAHSPFHLASKMPAIPYYIVHGDSDHEVNKIVHSDKFVNEIRGKRKVTYIEVPGMEHCQMPEDVKEGFLEFITSFAK